MSEIGAMHRERPAGRSLLDSLPPEAYRDLVANAYEEHFPEGTFLCHQDDPTSDVMVILSGRVGVSLRIGGRPRVVAVRGPGDLIGERTALAGETRSATVVTLDRVAALIVPPGAFSALIERHPAMLRTLRSIERERRVEDEGRPAGGFPPRRRPVDRDGATTAVLPATPADLTGRFDPEPPGMPVGPAVARQPLNCTIVLTDIAGFGDRRRNDGDRTVIREALRRMLREAFVGAWIPWHSCSHEGRGDGVLTVVPPLLSTAAVLHPMMGLLAARLRDHNRRAGPPVRIRLRMAVHVGPISTDREGLTGTAIVHTARLVEAARLKEQMLVARADLGVMASGYVFDNFVRHCDDLDPAEFTRVRIHEKEAHITGWMYLAGTRVATRRRPRHGVR
jgi:CRP-like cAMP-binding protein